MKNIESWMIANGKKGDHFYSDKEDKYLTAMLAAVFNSIHYTPTPKQRKIVSEILADEELIPLTKAHEICDYLKIERRHNRTIKLLGGVIKPTISIMAQMEKLRADFKNADEAFKNGLAQLSSEFQQHQEKETGKVSLDDGFLDKQPSDFGLFYCLSESLTQLERCIAEKPSRELSLVKTKLQEAIFWARQS